MTVVAIDGPAGAGKSTVAKLVAERLGSNYLDTGAMYRCVALEAMETGVDTTDAELLGAIARDARIELTEGSVKMNGRDVTTAIREPRVASVVSAIATFTPVRDALRLQQQAWIAARGGGVVEGRDIGTVVFPSAEVKIFLTASAEERAARRVGQSGGDVSEVAAQIAARDHTDSSRQDSPMRVADDAIMVDSTGMTIDEVVAEIVAIVRRSEQGRSSSGQGDRDGRG